MKMLKGGHDNLEVGERVMVIPGSYRPRVGRIRAFGIVVWQG